MDEWLVIGGIWVASAIACGFLAPSKGRESGTWFLYGLLFGVLAVAYLAFVGQPAPPADGVRYCKNCSRKVASDRERLCNHCGHPWAVKVTS